MSCRTVTVAVLCALALVAHSARAQDRLTYTVLATSKTSTMQKEMQEAGAAGYRFVAVMGGETAAGGNEVVTLMEKVEGDKARYEYRLLATSKTSTLQKELQQASDAGWQAVGQTVFQSLFGGQEAAAILERNSEQPRKMRYEFRLIATSRSSTLESELQQAADEGFRAVGLTVGKTGMGGSELLVVTRRQVK